MGEALNKLIYGLGFAGFDDTRIDRRAGNVDAVGIEGFPLTLGSLK